MSSLSNVTGLSFAQKLPGLLRSAKAGSLIEYTQPTRVEPIVLVDQRMGAIPYTTDIMQSLVSLFGGYYLQAVAISVNVGRVDVIKLLDALNPKRGVYNNAVNFVAANMEDGRCFTFRLPMPGATLGLEAFFDEDHMLPQISKPSMESVYDLFDPDTPSSGSNTSERDSGNIKNLTEAANLSVGKLLEVRVDSDGKNATFLIQLRAIANTIPSDGLVNILGLGSIDTGAKERYWGWKSGQLSFIKDIVFCQDVIDDHKRTLMKDRSGSYSEILRRRRDNSVSALMSGNPSVATASSMVVMTKATAKELERKIGGKLNDFEVREKVFRNTYTMIMVVVDPEWDTVTFYHRSIELHTELTAKEIQTANKGKGPDVAEILKAYQLGTNPTI